MAYTNLETFIYIVTYCSQKQMLISYVTDDRLCIIYVYDSFTHMLKSVTFDYP
jgi:hypothetical protein